MKAAVGLLLNFLAMLVARESGFGQLVNDLALRRFDCDTFDLAGVLRQGATGEADIALLCAPLGFFQAGMLVHTDFTPPCEVLAEKRVVHT